MMRRGGLHMRRQPTAKLPLSVSLAARTRIARLVLLCFILSLCASIASPVVDPRPMESVCSSTGTMKMVVHGDEGTQDPIPGQMKCPLCMPAAASPPTPAAALPHPLPLAHAVQPIPAARIAAATAAPLPARGPPAP